MVDPGDPWAGWVLGTDGLRAQYCELNRLGQWLRQPVNTVTNLGFGAAGLAVLLDRSGGRLAGAPRWLFGLSLVALCLGSGLFHASITLTAQRADMGATYAVVLALIGYGVLVHRPRTEDRAWLAVIGVLDVLFVVLDLFRQGTWLLPLMLALTLAGAVVAVAGWRPRVGLGHLARAGVGLLVGAASWILDFHKIGCDPTGWFQWHGLWHLATAVGAWELFRFLDRTAPRRDA
jgi:predicted membrane channel-forming protein YqfA (hemolysin III family)